MKLLKKSFQILAAVILVLAFALTVTACKNDRTTWKVTFYSQGKPIATQYPEDGSTAVRPEDPTREGFVFEGWYDSTYENVYDFDTPVTQDVNLYAKWDNLENYHKITFVTNNGSEVPTQYAKDGNTTPRPEDPTREGFTFLGWYDASYSTAYDFDTPVTQDVTLYAKWQATSSSAEMVTITLNYNYDSKTESVEIAKGATLPLANQQPEREDWNFAGWYKDSACTQLFNLTESLTADITLYAKWSKDPVQPADGTGIDFSKIPNNASGGVSGSDNFVFNDTINIGSVTAPVQPVQPAGSEDQYTVTFNSNGGSAVAAQSVVSKGKVVLPTAPEKSGNMFCGWYSDSDLTNAYDFDTAVTTNLTLYAKWASVDSRVKSVNGYNESLAVVWTDSNPSSATVQYKAADGNDWKTVESPLIRKVDGDARVDIVGLAAGEYNVKITPSSGAEITLPAAVAVSEYDRSGYAHFNRKSTEAAYGGVGAYNDDGSLKEGALVIYVNDANKNNVKEYVYKNTASGLVKEDISAYIKTGKPQLNGKDLGGDSYWSIGYILNNRGYASNTEREAYGIQKLTFTYSAVVVRLLGTITSETNYTTGAPSLYGLTYYAKAGQTNPITGEKYAKGGAVPNGGTVNDDGEMARITNAKNLTIEGIGEDAVMEGWGIHFVSNDNLHKNAGAGTSFEVRNITFKNYPEDAIGMEGTQGIKVDASTGSITQEGNASTARIISGVERCWIHNNTFLPGRCD
ncbi:MAG: InlB B-repeat-containing protein, partial [Clostridia bacterium]|nr:InlB B-repeat-containing protein [Clostridia bacterium]